MAADGSGLLEELLVRHAEPHRKYHSLQHLHECVVWLEQAAEIADRPAEVETALWFHEAVYDPCRSDNEERSAGWACSSLGAAGVEGPVIERVSRLILVTRHTAPPDSRDEQLIVDVDLAILGAPERRFAEYEDQIREEYAFVPQPVFREKRGAILQSFLSRERIYATEFFASRLELAARRNLSSALGGSALVPSGQSNLG